jgi:hypothetical protein
VGAPGDHRTLVDRQHNAALDACPRRRIIKNSLRNPGMGHHCTFSAAQPFSMSVSFQDPLVNPLVGP